MPGYRLTPDAQSDLIDIRRSSIERWGLTQSEHYLSELRERLRLVAETPQLGKLRPEVGQGVFGILHKRMVPLNHLVERTII